MERLVPPVTAAFTISKANTDWAREEAKKVSYYREFLNAEPFFKKFKDHPSIKPFTELLKRNNNS